MLTYRISKPKASRSSRKPPHIPRRIADADKRAILETNLAKTLFREGDCVRFKKPRRPQVVGTVVQIQRDVDEVTWGNDGTVPMNIVLEIDRGNGKSERMKTNVKKLVFHGVLV